MEEKQSKVCKICNKLKYRILDGKFDDINKRWINEDGKLWNGLVCPPCHKIRMKENSKNKNG